MNIQEPDGPIWSSEIQTGGNSSTLGNDLSTVSRLVTNSAISWLPFCRLSALGGLLILGATSCGADDDQSAGDTLSVVLTESAQTGAEVYHQAGCPACHGANGEGTIGPKLQGLAGTVVPLQDGTTVNADSSYLARSIADPGFDLVEGFTIRMPLNNLTETEINSVVAYLQEIQ